MYIVLVSMDGGGAGEAFGPFHNEEEAKKAAYIMYAEMCDMDEVDPDTPFEKTPYALSGPWHDVIEVRSP